MTASMLQLPRFFEAFGRRAGRSANWYFPDAGVEMLAIGFLDPHRGLERMEHEIIPRLKQLGLRN